MRLTNSEETYGLIHQVLHWTVAGLILFMIPLGVFMHELPHATQMEIDFKVWLYSLHKSVGIAVFFVAIARIIWATIQPHPRLLNHGAETLAAQTIHFLLYAMIILVPVFGWLHHAATDGFAPIWWWGFGDNLPLVPKSEAVAHFFGTAHWLAAIGLVLSLVLHIGGAIKHALVDKDFTLQRMVPGAYIETGVLPEHHKKTRKPLGLAIGALLLGAAAVLLVHFGLGDHKHDHSQETTNEAEAVTEKVPVEKAFQPNWTIDYSQSNVAVSVSQMGSPVEGRFKTFNADVFFEPENLAASRIDATVSTGSFDFGSNTEQALGADFLNAPAFPKARFVSNDITKTETGYRANGTLSLLGKEQDFTLDFTFEQIDKQANIAVTGTIPRLVFGIGNAYQGDDTVGRDVVLNINLLATRR